MKNIFKSTTVLMASCLVTAACYGQCEIYVQPPCVDRICYETYYGTGYEPPPPQYMLPTPSYCVTPECLAPDYFIPAPCSQRGEIFVQADFLYWKTHENGLNKCVPTKEICGTTKDGVRVSIHEEKNNSAKFQWSPGFRLGFGYKFADSAWDLSAYWTNLYSKANWNHASHKKSHWGLNLNVVDLLASYKFCLIECFSLRPYAGVRVASINQSIHSSFSQNNCSTDLKDGLGIKGRNHADFVGVGPLVGVEGVLSLKHGFNLYGSAAVSGLYADFHTHSRMIERVPCGYNYSALKQHKNAWETVVDLALGLRWMHAFGCNQSIRLVVDLGLEHHCFYKQNRFNSIGLGESHRGDLFFDGGTLSAKLIF